MEERYIYRVPNVEFVLCANAVIYAFYPNLFTYLFLCSLLFCLVSIHIKFPFLLLHFKTADPQMHCTAGCSWCFIILLRMHATTLFINLLLSFSIIQILFPLHCSSSCKVVDVQFQMQNSRLYKYCKFWPFSPAVIQPFTG